jgi:predicted nucleic acid-binding protein
MEIVYLETSFISLLVADPSRHLVTAANQQVTRDWWQRRRQEFLCIASDEVRQEASKGDPEQVRRRLELLAELTMVQPAREAESLTQAFLATGALPANAQTDAAHLAIATASSADYLLTWNCRHLANAQILRRLEREAKTKGWKLPTVCTPAELMGDLPYESESDS